MMLDQLDRYREEGLLILRVGIGLMFMFAHGMGKLFGGPEQWERVGEAAQYVGLDFLPIFWGFLAAVAEFVGGLLLALGALFRLALVFLISVMIVATTMHLTTGMGSPYQAIEMGIVFFSLLFTGPGKYSLDAYYSHRYRHIV